MADETFNFVNENKTEYGSVTCLGLTFKDDDERREHFRNELREKLPELKKIEGYPIGKDEDIIELSDPPYYTACPNPWLNDFVDEWEKEKVKIPGHKKDFKVDKPYASDVSEGKNNTIYQSHTYHTKVPYYAILRYILHYTQPGDIVLDGFSGTGMAGLACQIARKPERAFKNKIEKEQKNINWGERNIILGELSPIANFIAHGFTHIQSVYSFSKEVEQILNQIEENYSWMYLTKHSESKYGKIDYIVWSDVYSCPVCNHEMIFWEKLIDHKKFTTREEVVCGNCKKISKKRDLIKVWINKYDYEISNLIQVNKRLPVLIKYEFNGKSYEKKPDDFDLDLIEKIDKQKIHSFVPIDKLPSGVNTSQPIKANGVKNVHQFFSKRNLFILSLLYENLKGLNKILFTSMMFRSSNLNMTVISNYLSQKKGKTVGGWAGRPMNGTYYLPTISTEVSAISSLKTRVQTIKNLIEYKADFNNDKVIINTGSSTNLMLKENSVDYIFTDPPFGANINYSELNFLWESWLGVKTNIKEEAIENKIQNKSVYDYQNLMLSCFKEFYRVLKPSKWMTVEFSNTSAAIWNGIQTALQRSGFIIANIAALDKKQGTFKSNTTPTAVKQDLIISCYKPSGKFADQLKILDNKIGIWEFLKEHLEHLPIQIQNSEKRSAVIERSPKILYDRLISFYLMRGLPIPIDAADFQEGLRQRFDERDGMYFTKVQSAEYDQLYHQTKGEQFVLVFDDIYSESDAVLWLKERLQRTPQTYQDIMPDFRKANRVNRKGELVAELKTVLDENFIQEKDGKWRVPNMNEAKDREAIRNKSLLKEFDSYKDELEKSKTKKIKEVRVEALRAGFKTCWEKKDFRTIVNIGEKIPQNILLEDEQLLMFYDIAKDRI